MTEGIERRRRRRKCVSDVCHDVLPVCPRRVSSLYMQLRMYGKEFEIWAKFRFLHLHEIASAFQHELEFVGVYEAFESEHEVGHGQREVSKICIRQEANSGYETEPTLQFWNRQGEQLLGLEISIISLESACKCRLEIKLGRWSLRWICNSIEVKFGPRSDRVPTANSRIGLIFLDWLWILLVLNMRCDMSFVASCFLCESQQIEATQQLSLCLCLS